jgi:hypothetical protein
MNYLFSINEVHADTEKGEASKHGWVQGSMLQFLKSFRRKIYFSPTKIGRNIGVFVSKMGEYRPKMLIIILSS